MAHSHNNTGSRSRDDSVIFLRGVGQPARRGTARWILGILAVATAVGGYWYLHRGTHEEAQPLQPAAISVRVARVTTGNMPVVERTIGTVVSDAMVDVTAMVPGRVERSYFREGQIVKKGAMLFQLDPRIYQAALSQAEGQLTKDRALLEGAMRNLERERNLMAAGAGTRQALDDKQATVASLQGAVEADKANVDRAAINMEYTRIRSPIDGKTGPILIQPGNVIAVSGTGPSTTPLVTVSQVSPIKVSFALPQADLPRLQARQKNHSLMASVALRNGGEKSSAPVSFIGNAINSQTGTIEMRVTLPNRDGSLVPGQVVNVSVALDDIAHATIVPHEAVNNGPAGRYVFVVKDGKAETRPIKMLFDDSHNVAVQGSLRPGEEVVVDGQLRLAAGTPVVIDMSQDAEDTGGAISAVPE